MDTTSVIRQKSESQNGGNKKAKHAKFSEKRTFLTPWYGHVLVRVRGYKMFVFPKNLACLLSCYLRFEIHPFALLPTTNQIQLCKYTMESVHSHYFLRIFRNLQSCEFVKRERFPINLVEETDYSTWREKKMHGKEIV